MTLSSVVVQTRPENLQTVITSLKESGLCEFHLNDEKGRIIITIEGKGVEEEIGKLGEIQTFPHIISAEMMYSYSEEELDKLRENIDTNIPDWMNDADADVKKIVYNGDLKKRY